MVVEKKSPSVDSGVRASVAMAVFNGGKYLVEQIDSILGMMSDKDELVISYEESEDNTLDLINSYARADKRVRIVYDTGNSFISNFNNAVSFCRGKYIFLADQDDVWIQDKINRMCSFLEGHPEAVIAISDGYFTDENLNRQYGIFEYYHTSPSSWRNFIKGGYCGCQMAFDNRIRDKVWPVPERSHPPITHDLWLGILGSYYGKVLLMEDKCILHRLHAGNFTSSSKLTLTGVIKNRFFLFREILRRILENRKK